VSSIQTQMGGNRVGIGMGSGLQIASVKHTRMTKVTLVSAGSGVLLLHRTCGDGFSLTEEGRGSVETSGCEMR
jgi:hypothetical protein